ncbi:MAG TPA: nuclear transport factor 2 family protein [Candidatus Margulisiibacteriota bacterium]|nr:nuclear transport factor 2 family protein [Candidatus Margulisiibacteriota bacterium]
MNTEDSLQLAERLFGAITTGNVEAVRQIYAPDAVIWHNNDGLEQSADANLQVLQWVVANIRNLRYENVRRQRTDSGFMQQHVLRGTAPNGRQLDIPACIVCTVRNGRITRLDEYLDSAHIAPLVKR